MFGLITHRVKKIFIWLFLLTISIVFVFWGAVGLRLGDNKYIEVNGEKIYPQDLSLFKRVYPEANLVQITITTQALSKIGFSLSDEQVDEVIRNLPLFQVDGQFSIELYNRFLSRNLSELTAIRKIAYFNTLAQQMTFALQQSTVAFPSSTASYYKLLDQKRQVGVLTVDQDKFKTDVETNPDELHKYYENNKSNFNESAKVKLEYIKLSYPDLVKSIQVKKKDIENYYSENLEQFTRPGKKRIAQIVIDMKKQDAKEKLNTVQASLKEQKSTFAELAKKYSDDKPTARKLGDAGWFQPGDMGNVELDKALGELVMKEQVSSVVTANDKWYIFSLLEQKPQEQLKLSEVEQNIKTILSEQKANTIYAELKQELDTKSFEIAERLDIVAQEMNLKLEETEWLDQSSSNDSAGDDLSDSRKQSIANNPKVIETAFSEDVLENRNNSPVIEIDAETSIVFRIKEYKPSRTKEFAEVQKDILTLVKQIKARQKAREHALKLWQDFVSNNATMQELEQMAKKNKYVDFQKPKDISYLDTFWNANGDYKQELSYAFDLPKPTKEHPLQARLVSLDNGNQSILALDKVTLGEFESISDEQKEQTANQLKYYMLMRDNANFLQRVISTAEVNNYIYG